MYSVLNTAISGLSAAQRAMDLTGQNIANVNTPGYSRQEAVFSSVGQTAAGSYTGRKTVLGGVTLDAIVRVHNAFLESARVDAGSRLGALTAEATALDGAQQALTGPGAGSVLTSIDAFYRSWNSQALNPGGSGQTVIQAGQLLATQLNTAAQGVNTSYTNTRQTLDDVVRQTNIASKSLADLNEQIRQGSASGLAINELLDKRDDLVRQLGQLVGATSVPGDFDTVQVAVNGVQIVASDGAKMLTFSGGNTLGGVATDPPVIRQGTNSVRPESGQAAGMLAAMTTDLPNVMTQLDAAAASLVTKVNYQHRQGFTLGTPAVGTTPAVNGTAGGDFFTVDTPPSALTVKVAVTSSSQLAVSSSATALNGDNAAKIGDLSIDAVSATTPPPPAAQTPGISVLYRDLVSTVGSSVASLDFAVATQNTIVTSADQAVESDSGVNIDEELTNMLLYQRAFQASAKVVTVADEMLQTLIDMKR